MTSRMARPRPNKLQLPSLDTGPVPLVGIRDTARRQLLELIDSRRGKKALILDQSISGPIGQLDGSLSELLTEHGVNKLLYLENKAWDDPSYNQGEARLVDSKNIIYIVRATVENAQLVAQQVKRRPPDEIAHDVCVFLVPRRTIACERVLEEEGVLGDVLLGEYPLDLVPCEDDVLSLELGSAFRDCVVDGDSTSLFYTACAIMRLQGIFGLIPRLQGKGPAAAAVRDMCLRMRRETPGATATTSVSRISRAVLIDREVDLLTPMMSQITFEGLIDEVTGITNGAVPWQPKDKKAAESGAGEYSRSVKGSTLLNSTDPFYKEFRDLPYHTTIMRLQAYAKDARKEYAELGSKDLSELKSFVKGLPKLLMLDRLSDVATPVAATVRQQQFHDRLKREQDCVDTYDVDGTVAYIEELMYRGSDLLEVLRLMVLLCTAQQGLQRRHLEALRQEVLHTYGHQHVLTLDALEKSGLLKANAGIKSTFPTVRKALRLLVSDEEAAVEPPTDISHLYKGYAPLSIRLVEVALRSGWSPHHEVLLNLLGGHFDVLQTLDAHGLPSEKPFRVTAPLVQLSTAAGTSQALGAAGGSSFSGGSGSSSSSHVAPGGTLASGSKPPEVVLVVFIGGVTFSEISALRFLSTRPDTPQRFLILTTSIVNGKTLLQKFIDTGIPAP